MSEQTNTSVYRAFRASAYRSKYERALFFGGRWFTFGALLSRAEYACNTFRQMGVEPGDRVCFCLPDCPDLLASFYGLARLGGVGVPAHPASSPRELEMQMRAAGAKLLITTEDRYERYRAARGALPPAALILCRPEKDMRRRARRAYRRALPVRNEEAYRLDALLEENRFHAGDAPHDAAECAVVLFGTSCFLQARSVVYTPEELESTAEEFWRHQDRVRTVYVENSFATEGGFLAVHSALCSGRTVIWSVGDPLPLLARLHPDYLVATEEFFWRFRQEAALFRGKWSNLQGGCQIGRELTPLMEKFAARAFAAAGGTGALRGAPVPLKIRREALYYAGDFGVRLADMEREFSRIEGVAKCRCAAEHGGIRLRVLPNGKCAVRTLGRAIAACCRQEMNERHLPRTVEFCTRL